jgi:hypothetical protein
MGMHPPPQKSPLTTGLIVLCWIGFGFFTLCALPAALFGPAMLNVQPRPKWDFASVLFFFGIPAILLLLISLLNKQQKG